MIEHMREQITVTTSPDFLAALPNVKAVGQDPLHFGLGPIVPNGGVLGLQKKDVEKKDLDDKTPVQEVGTSASSTFIPQDRPKKEKENDTATAPPASKKEAEEKTGGKDSQAAGVVHPPEPAGAALLPAKRSFRSLNALDTELTNSKYRLQEGIGLHPTPLVPLPYAPGPAGAGMAAETGPGNGWPATGYLQPEAPAVQAGNQQQVMSPTCDQEKRAFGSSGSAIPAEMLPRAGSKRHKEGPIGDSEDQRRSIPDLKKEIKDEVTKEIKAEYGKLINQFNETARREIENNQRVLENMIKENLERQEEWGRTLMTNFQGLQVEVGHNKALMEALRDHVPRELREELTDTVDAFKDQIETRINLINETLRKGMENLTEAERAQVRLVDCRMNERESRHKGETDRTLKEQTRRLAEAEGRMQEEVKAARERMDAVQEEITALALEPRSGTASPAAGEAGIDHVAKMMKTTMLTLKQEVEEVRRQGNLQTESLKGCMSSRDFNVFREEFERDIIEVREIKRDMAASQEVLRGLNEDKRVVIEVKQEVQEATKRIEQVEKRRREDLHNWSQEIREINTFKKTKGDCQMLVEKVQELEASRDRTDQACRRLTNQTQELEKAVPDYQKMKKELEDFAEIIETAMMEVGSRGESLQHKLKETENHEELVERILNGLYEKVKNIQHGQSVLQKETEKHKQQLDPLQDWSKGVANTFSILHRSLSAEIEVLKTTIAQNQPVRSVARSVQDGSDRSTGSWDKITEPRSGQERRSMLPEGIRQGTPLQAGPGFRVKMGGGRSDEDDDSMTGEIVDLSGISGPRVHLNVMNASTKTQTIGQTSTSEGRGGKLQAIWTSVQSGHIGSDKPSCSSSDPQAGGLLGRAGDAIGSLFSFGNGAASHPTGGDPSGGATGSGLFGSSAGAGLGSPSQGIQGGGLFSGQTPNGLAPGGAPGGGAGGLPPLGGGLPGTPGGSPIPPGFPLGPGGPPGGSPGGGGPPGGGGGSPGGVAAGWPFGIVEKGTLTFDKDFPKLTECATSPWKKQTEFTGWMHKVMTYANGIHSRIGDYVGQCLRDADYHFTTKKGHEGPSPNILPEWREVDHKLVAVCMKALPDRVTEDCYRVGMTDTFTRVLFNVFCLVNPGGEREVECLTQFCRLPPSMPDAAGARRTLEEWVVARNRLQQLSTLDMIPKERFDAMKRIVEQICQRNSRFKTMWDTKCVLNGPGFHDHTDDSFAQATEEWLRHELKGLESNEALENAQQQGPPARRWEQWNPDHQHYPTRIAAAQVGGNSGGGQPVAPPRTDGRPDKRKEFVCYDMKNKGSCTKDNCPYSHDPNTWKEYDRSRMKMWRQPQQGGDAGKDAPPRLAAVRLSVNINEIVTLKDKENDGALLDSGASEVVRPYIYHWHLAIKEGRSGGKDIPICLAGGCIKKGVMTYTGEIMIPREKEEIQCWILPINRIVHELGGVVSWDMELFQIVFPNGRVVIGMERPDGLRYVNRGDLKWIRNALEKNHFKGRLAAKKIKLYKLNGSGSEEEIENFQEQNAIITKEMLEAAEEVEAWKAWECQAYDHDEVWINKLACDKYLKDCVTCRLAKTRKRPHWRGGMKNMKLTLCADLTGPHPEVPGLGYRYLLVLIAIDKEGRRLPFCRGLRSKRGAEVSIAVESVIKEIRALDPDVEFVRFHTDAGKEFLNTDVEKMLRTWKLHQTHTGGHDPQANGLAEKYVGIVKGRARSYLIHSRLQVRFWYWACMQVAAVMRLDALDQKLAKGAPTFGDTIVIRKPEATGFEERGALGTFLCWSSVVPMGAWVLTFREDGSEKIPLVSLPANWKRVEERRWKLTRDPNSNMAVWVDQDGDVKFDQPEEGTIMTFEERHLPPNGAGGHYVPALERFHFGVEEDDLKLVVPECDQGQEQLEPESGEADQPEAEEHPQRQSRQKRWKVGAMKEDQHILYEDEDGEVQVHEALALSSSDEEVQDVVEVRPPIVLDKVVVDLKHQIKELRREVAHVKAAKVIAQDEAEDKEDEKDEKEKDTRYYLPCLRRRLMMRLPRLMRW